MTASHVNRTDQRQQQHSINHDKHDDGRTLRQDVVCVEDRGQVGDGGIGADGKRMSDRGVKSSFESNTDTTTTNIISVHDDDMTTTDNDDIARRATSPMHGEDRLPSECGAIQEAGG